MQQTSYGPEASHRQCSQAKFHRSAISWYINSNNLAIPLSLIAALGWNCSSPQLSASGQLQETLQQLQESSRDKALLTQRLHHKEGEVRHLEKALAQVRGDLLEKEGMVVRLRDQVESAKREKEVHGRWEYWYETRR